MTEKKLRHVLICLTLLALTVLLCGCEQKIEEGIFDNKADYSINIALPYATVTPPPAAQIESKALEIDASGNVTVNDAVTVLESEQANESESNYKSLRQGNTGLAVQALQSRLQELGYYTAAISGIFDDETEAAVRRFEQTYGTMQTGVATSDFQTRLFSANAIVYGSAAYNDAVVAQYQILQPGDVGSGVYALQQRLKSLGYPINTLTGIFDDETANAVRLFYEAYNLAPREIANVSLQKELYGDSAQRYGNAVSAEDEAVGTMLGETIDDLQVRLSELGYLVNVASGSYDVHTEMAVKLFEEAHGRLPTISLDDETRTLLFSKDAKPFDEAYAQYSNLIEGSGGEEVLRLQKRLVSLGFVRGTPTGEYGDATTAAMKLFQLTNSLDETGVAGRYDQAVLFSSFALDINGEIPAQATVLNVETITGADIIEDAGAPHELSTGSTGDDVLDLQNRLTELGYVSSVTGTYDNLTSRAVANFQTAIGVEDTGTANVSLIAFLYSNAAPGSGTFFHTNTQKLEPLARDDTGEDVTNLQKRLWKLGYLDREQLGDGVGIYEGVTESAVRSVQEAIGMSDCDGIASPELRCYLTADASDAIKKE